MNARLLVAVLLLGAVLSFALWPRPLRDGARAIEQGSPPNSQAAPGTVEVESGSERAPGASDRRVVDGASQAPSAGAGGPLRWADLLVPTNRTSGAVVADAQVVCLSDPEEALVAFGLDDPVEAALLDGEVLAEVRAPGFLDHPFLPRDLDRTAEEPRVLELVPTAPLVIEIVGESPPLSPFAAVTIAAVGVEEGFDVAQQLERFLGREIGELPTGGGNPWSGSSGKDVRERAWRRLWGGDPGVPAVDLTGLDALQLFVGRATIDPDDEDRRVEMPAVPLDVELHGSVVATPLPSFDFMPEHHFVAALDAEEQFVHPVLVPTFVHHGGDTPGVRITFAGAATLLWTLPTGARTTELRSRSFELLDRERVGYMHQPRRLDDGRYAYAWLVPGPHRFMALWTDASRTESSCVRIELDLPVGGELQLGELEATLGHRIEFRPRVVLGDGVDPARRTRLEEALELSITVVEDRAATAPFHVAHEVRARGGEARCHGVSSGTHRVRVRWNDAQVRGSAVFEGLQLLTTSDFDLECSGDDSVEIEVRVERAHPVDVAIRSNSDDVGFFGRGLALSAADGSRVTLNPDPRSSDPGADPLDRRYRGELSAGTWWVFVSPEAGVGWAKVVVERGGGSFVVDVVQPVELLLDRDDPRIPGDLPDGMPSGPLALPVGWPRAIGYSTCQGHGSDEQGRRRFGSLLPFTEYEFTVDGSRFTTGEPGSMVDLSR